MRHTLRKHGNAALEAKRGQKAITKDDFSRITEIVRKPSAISGGYNKGNNGEPRVVFEKLIGADHYTYVAEVRRGKRRLDGVTMWKK